MFDRVVALEEKIILLLINDRVCGYNTSSKKNFIKQTVGHFKTVRKIPPFSLISWCGRFVEKHSFNIVLGELPEPM